MPNYKIADLVFSYTPRYDYTKNLCKNYQVDEEQVQTAIVVSDEDIKKEGEKALPQKFPIEYLESLALYRKFLEFAFNHDTIILHCSALALDNQAYLFTAPSGTGKSTHTRLWREMLGDKAVMVNDDKPIVRYVDGAFYV